MLGLLLAAPTSRAQSCASSPLGLLGWWAGESSAEDETGVNNGSLQGGTSFVGGLVGSAFSFDGVDDYVAVPAATSLDVGSGNGFTIEFWMRPGDVTSPHCIVEWNNGTGGIGVHLWHSIGALGGLGSLFVNVVDSSGNDHYIASAPGLLSTVALQHIALTYDKMTGVAKVFHNGVVVATQSLGVFTPRTSYPLYFGARFSGLSSDSYFNGLLDEVSLYGRALSDTEIQAIHQAGTAGKCNSPQIEILEHPESRAVLPGADVTFKVVSTGSNRSYQWRFDEEAIPLATNATLRLLNVQTNQSGRYSVIVSNTSELVVSSNAVLTVGGFCVAAANGLVSWWPAEGNAFDPVRSNDASLQGGVSFVEGIAGRAFSFDGVNDYAALPASASLDVGGGEGFTLECWIKPANVTSAHALMEWNSGTAPGVQFWTSIPALGGAGSLFANITDTNGVNHILASPSGILNTADFQHVALTYSRTNGQARLYRNGDIVASENVGVFRPQTTHPLYFGKRVSGAAPDQYQGLLDEAALYNRDLTDVEINAIFVAGGDGKNCKPPEILSEPQSKIVFPGSNIMFSATVRGTGPLIYQWFGNGAALAGGTNESLTLSNVQPSLAGLYSVRVTNALGIAISSNAILKVIVMQAAGNGQPLTNDVHFFAGPVTLQLQNVYSGGLVFYTLDGSNPSFVSTQYTGPFVVNQNHTLRAIGFSVDFIEAGELDPIQIAIVPAYSLTTISKGGGMIERIPTSDSYLSNAVVILTAVPNPGWTFLKWLGDANGATASTDVAMTRNKSAEAVFGTTLNTTAAGGGNVVLNPPGGVYSFGSIVQITARPNAGNQFGIWGNAASGNVNPIFFTVTNANPTVSALFGSVSSGQSALTVVPVGRGQIAVTPGANSYATGSDVIIAAMPETGQSFLGWSGDASGTANPLSLILDANKLVYANFTKRPRLILAGDANVIRREGARLILITDPGDHVTIDWSTNLVDWNQLVVVTNLFGLEQLADPSTTNSMLRFYRAVLKD